MRPGALDEIAFFDLLELAEQHGADALFFEVQRDAEHAVREFEHLAGHRVVDAVHARDAVADRDDAADLGNVHVDGVTPDLFADDLGNLFGVDGHMLCLKGQIRFPACCVRRAAPSSSRAAAPRFRRKSSIRCARRCRR